MFLNEEDNFELCLWRFNDSNYAIEKVPINMYNIFLFYRKLEYRNQHHLDICRPKWTGINSKRNSIEFNSDGSIYYMENKNSEITTVLKSNNSKKAECVNVYLYI